MQAAARAGRFGLLLAVLLVLLGGTAAVAPGSNAGDRYAEQHPVWVMGEAVSAAPSMRHDLEDFQDWLRLSVGTLRAPATALPDTWWAVCTRAAVGYPPPGRLLLGEVSSPAMATAVPTPRSSRAPPVHLL